MAGCTLRSGQTRSNLQSQRHKANFIERPESPIPEIDGCEDTSQESLLDRQARNMLHFGEIVLYTANVVKYLDSRDFGR